MRALILTCAQNRLGILCIWLVFFRWNEPVPTDRKSAAGLSSVIELKNEFTGDIAQLAGELLRKAHFTLFDSHSNSIRISGYQDEGP